MFPLFIFHLIALFIPFILLLAPLKKLFPLSKGGAGAKAMGKAKGVLGVSTMEKNENQDEVLQPGGDLSPFPPRKSRKMEQGQRT